MKLANDFTIRYSLLLFVILTVWAVMFYMAIMIEVNDEVDDSLEVHAEYLMSEMLSGQTQPLQPLASNNQHFIRPVSQEYAASHPLITYADSMVYVVERNESEPARVYTCLFQDDSGQYHQLTVLTPTIEKYDLKEAIAFWIFGLYAVMLIVLIALSAWTFKRNLRPLYRLLNWLDQYKIGGHNQPLDNETKIDELATLNQSVQGYVARGKQMIEQQKQFIGNASHEMQTPIAICQNRIEMLLDGENLTDAQVSELAKVHNTLSYMSKLNKSLLLLTRIENGQFTERQCIDVNAEVTNMVADFKEVYDHLQLTTEVITRGQWRVSLNETLARMLLANLIKNAYVHNVSGGQVLIELGSNSMTVKNTAHDGPLDGTRIFERFYQGDKHEGSTGLGLSICDTICRAQQLVLSYAFEQGLHCFRVAEK